MKDKKKITEMCIYIDEHIYNGDYNENIVFDYLLDIFYRLAKVEKLFNRESEYEDYSMFCACLLYKRLTNEKQFNSGESAEKMEKITSVLNYIKKVLRPWKLKYIKQNYQQNFDVEELGAEKCDSIRQVALSSIDKSNREFKRIDIEFYLESLPKTIYKVVSESNYATNNIIKKNMCMSCTLTLLSQMTLSNDSVIALNDYSTPSNYYEKLTRLVAKELNNDNVILWHLDNSMKDLISILCVRIKKLLSYNLFDIISYYEDSAEVTKNILMTPVLENYGEQ